jgi:hypothetical protein
MNPDNDNTISLAEQIIQVESNLKEGVSAITEILGMMADEKTKLQELKGQIKTKLQNIHE